MEKGSIWAQKEFLTMIFLDKMLVIKREKELMNQVIKIRVFQIQIKNINLKMKKNTYQVQRR